MTARTVFALVCVANVATGLLLGVALDRAVLAPSALAAFDPTSPEEVFRALDLTAEQTPRILALIERRRPEIERIVETVRPRFEAFEASADAELATILTAEQLARFQTLKASAKLRRFGPPGSLTPPGGATPGVGGPR